MPLCTIMIHLHSMESPTTPRLITQSDKSKLLASWKKMVSSKRFWSALNLWQTGIKVTLPQKCKRCRACSSQPAVNCWKLILGHAELTVPQCWERAQEGRSSHPGSLKCQKAWAAIKRESGLWKGNVAWQAWTACWYSSSRRQHISIPCPFPSSFLFS